MHGASPRRRERFVAINCAAIPEHLLESEPSATRKAPSPGGKNHLGKIETANNGTLMLDEIGDLPHSLQAACCAFCRSASSSGSAGDRRFRSMSGSFARLTRISSS